MIKIRPAAARGRTRYEWLDSRHTFSFADYYDPGQMGFRALRVINDDRVGPGAGFGMHPHRNMEILSYVLTGALEHRDSMGNGSVIRPGELQRMSAGSGVLHSEKNPSKIEPVHFLQVWILPDGEGLRPSYDQRAFPAEQRRGKLRLIASQDGRDQSVLIHQDVSVYSGLLKAGERLPFRLSPGRHAWVQMARGSAALNGHRLEEGDGAAVSRHEALDLEGFADGEVLVFDLA